MRTKLYFETDDSKLCYPASYFDKGTEVFEAIPIKPQGVFWCKELSFVGNEGCGRECEFYTPRNGKSGMCKFRSNTLFEQGAKAVL